MSDDDTLLIQPDDDPDDPTEKPNWKDKLLNWAFKSWNGGLSSEQNDRYDQYAKIASGQNDRYDQYDEILAQIAADLAAYTEEYKRHQRAPEGADYFTPFMDAPQYWISQKYGIKVELPAVDPPFGFIPEDLDDPKPKKSWPDKLLNWAFDSLIGRCCLFAVCFIVGCALALPALLIVLWLWK